MTVVQLALSLGILAAVCWIVGIAGVLRGGLPTRMLMAAAALTVLSGLLQVFR